MRKILILVAASFLFFNCIAAPMSALSKPPKLNAKEVFLPVGKTGETISLMELSTVKMDQLEKLTGKKLNFFERIAFKKAQKKLRQSIADDGTIYNRKLEKIFSNSGDDLTSGFHLGGFALGLFLFLIGVLIAYLINDANHSVRVKWAWIGAAIAAVLWIIISIL